MCLPCPQGAIPSPPLPSQLMSPRSGFGRLSLLRLLPPAGLRGPALEGLPPLFEKASAASVDAPHSPAGVSTAKVGGPLRLRPTIPHSRTAVFFRLGILSRLFLVILTIELIRNPQLLLVQPQQFAGWLPPGRASNHNQKKNGRDLRPLHVLYMGLFWAPSSCPCRHPNCVVYSSFARYYQHACLCAGDS